MSSLKNICVSGGRKCSSEAGSSSSTLVDIRLTRKFDKIKKCEDAKSWFEPIEASKTSRSNIPIMKCNSRFAVEIKYLYSTLNSIDEIMEQEEGIKQAINQIIESDNPSLS